MILSLFETTVSIMENYDNSSTSSSSINSTDDFDFIESNLREIIQDDNNQVRCVFKPYLLDFQTYIYIFLRRITAKYKITSCHVIYFYF